MRFDRLGEEIRCFVISSGAGCFGDRVVKEDPETLKGILGGVFSFTTRYLYMVPLYIFYADKTDVDAPVTVRGEDVGNRKDVIKGDVVIFARDGDRLRDLTDFDVEVLKDNVTLEKDDGRNHVTLGGVSLRYRAWAEIDHDA